MAGVMDKFLMDGNLVRNNVMVHGMYKGYYTIIQMVPGTQFLQIKINFSFPESADVLMFRNNVSAYLNQLKVSDKRVQEVAVDNYAVRVKVSGLRNHQKFTGFVDGIVNGILSCLYSLQASSGCSECGMNMGVSAYDINGEVQYICPSCVQRMNYQLENAKQQKSLESSNLLPGIIGAVLFALAGAVVWVLIYSIGYIAGLAGVLIVLAAMKGYQIFGKYLDKKGVIISIIVSLVIVFAANHISWIVACYKAYRDAGRNLSFGRVVKRFSRVMTELDIWGYYYKDLIIGYLLSFVASFSLAAKAFRDASGGYSIKKL